MEFILIAILSFFVGCVVTAIRLSERAIDKENLKLLAENSKLKYQLGLCIKKLKDLGVYE